jgi:hypothetical protein
LPNQVKEGIGRSGNKSISYLTHTSFNTFF